MSDLIGIDLGTTNSCVAIQGEYANCYVSPRIPGYSVITDRLSRNFTPSVVYYTGLKNEPFIVGSTAKRQIDGKYPPVMFAKRHLGTDKKFQVDDNLALSPEEVSAEILRYLKAMAEARLGRVFNRAVVTVPAYFGINPKNLTKQAMIEAGFIVDDDHYILQEPVAAALTYTQTTQEEDFRIMVYDLGGGTFDITVLEKSGPLIEIKAFGGDAALGGWEFDKLLADHVIERLCERGYALDVHPQDDLNDRMIYTKLLLEAENAKIELSNRDVMEYHMRRPGIFTDKNNEPVDLDLVIERPVFEDFIKLRVDETIGHCHTTLGKSGIRINDINAIVMVGSSSYIPYIQNRLFQEFGIQPQLLVPDLAVAIGAAVYSTKFGTVVEQGVRLEFENLPVQTGDNPFILTGNVRKLAGGSFEEGFLVEVAGQSGAFRETISLSDTSTFYFELPLQPNALNQFVLRVKDPQGTVEAEVNIQLQHAVEAVEARVTIKVEPKLSKTINVVRKTGITALATEGVNLPYEKEIECKIVREGDEADDSPLRLVIDVLEEDYPVGQIIVDDIPSDIAEGEKVIVAIKIAEDFQIHARAYIPGIDRVGHSIIEASRPRVLDKDEIQKIYDNLKGRWETLKLLLTQDERAQYGLRIERLFRRIEESLKGNDPDTTEASSVLTSIKQILREIEQRGPTQLNPSHREFMRTYEEARALVKQAEREDASAKNMAMLQTLDVTLQQAEEAYKRQAQPEWQACYQRVTEILSQANDILRRRTDEQPPNPQALLMALIMHVSAIRQATQLKQNHSHYSRWMEQLEKAERKLQNINLSQGDNALLNDLRTIYRELIQPVEEEVKRVTGAQVKIAIE